MTAAEMIEAVRSDSCARLKWRVLRQLGVSPLSLRARLLTKRRTLRLACQMILDLPAESGGSIRESNPNFDMARFDCLAGS